MTKKLILPLMVAAITAVLTACGTASGPTSMSDRDSSAAAEEMSESNDDVQSTAQTLINRIRGTSDQRAAAQFLIDYALNHLTDTCMTEKGFEDWDPPELKNQAPGIIEPFGDSVWLREPMRPIASQELIVNNAFALGEEVGRRQNLAPEMDRALVDCLNSGTADVPSDDDLRDYNYSPLIARTDAAFNYLWKSIDDNLAPTDEYNKCMNDAGISTKDILDHGIVGYSAVRLRLENVEAPSPQDVSTASGELSESWKAFVALEAETLQADANCRNGVYESGMTKIAPALVAFETSHGADLRELDQHWTSVAQEAVDLGFVA